MFGAGFYFFSPFFLALLPPSGHLWCSWCYLVGCRTPVLCHGWLRGVAEYRCGEPIIIFISAWSFPFLSPLPFLFIFPPLYSKGGVCPGWNKPFLDQSHTNTSFQITNHTMLGPNILYLAVCNKMSMSFWMQIRKIMLFHQKFPESSIIIIFWITVQYLCSVIAIHTILPCSPGSLALSVSRWHHVVD